MNKYKYIFVILFVLVISGPTLFMPLYNNDYGFENRTKKELPEYGGSYTEYMKNMRNYYNDNFAFRDLLYKGYFHYKWDLFHSNVFPSKLVIGKDGWFYLGNEYQYEFNTALGLNDDYMSRLEQARDEAIEMQSFCDSLNIGFYYAIVPNKSTFYPEFLPLKPNNRPRLITEAMQLISEAGVNVIDLGDYMWKRKKDTVLYYKTDSHWNAYGAFLGTEQLLNEIRKEYPVGYLKQTSYNVDTVIVDKGMDIASMLNLNIQEEHIRFTLKDDISTSIDTIYANSDNVKVVIESKVNKVRAIVFRDSFFTLMRNFFSDNVGYYITENRYFNRELILEEKPDFVVFQIAERRFLYFDEKTFIR